MACQPGADVNALDDLGCNSLHAAVINSSKNKDPSAVTAIGKYLMDHGVDASITDASFQLDALHCALMGGWDELATILIEKVEGNLELPDQKGFRPLLDFGATADS
jgi:hypothetical protein